MDVRKELVIKAEREIDQHFENSPLVSLGFTQATWTFLSLVEDHFFQEGILKDQKIDHRIR